MNYESFEDFYKSLIDMVKPFEEKNSVKIRTDLDANIIKIYGHKMDSISSAKASLDEILEIAYSTAEHHPYWNLIYCSSQISKLVLEKWHEDLTQEEIDEISWYIEELKNTYQNLKKK